MKFSSAFTLLLGVAGLALNVEAKSVHIAARRAPPAVANAAHSAVVAAPPQTPVAAIKPAAVIAKPAPIVILPAVTEPKCCNCICFIHLKLVKVTHWIKIVFGFVKDKNAHMVAVPIAKQEGYILEFAPVNQLPPTTTSVHQPTTPNRIWHDSTGQYQVEAEFKRFEHGQVWLHKPNGVTIHVPAERLAVSDLIFIERLLRQQHNSALLGAIHHAQPFHYRYQHAIMLLGPWEGAAVLFVFCAGFVVMMRMFYVFMVLGFRSYRARHQGVYEFNDYGPLAVEELYVSPPQYLPTQAPVVPKPHSAH